jgi:hypothetical protein
MIRGVRNPVEELIVDKERHRGERARTVTAMLPANKAVDTYTKVQLS